MNTSLHNIMVTGGNGQLASALKKINPDLIYCEKSELDITNKTSIETAVKKYQPRLIINTAAFTAVDKAEAQLNDAMLINHEGAKNIALVCENNHIPLIHISTDYVFDGAIEHRFSENDKTNPVNAYGQSKLLGEEAVREHCKQYVILRVSGVFSEFGNNFLKTMLRLAQERDELNVVDDQFTCPTYAVDIAKATLTIANNFSHTGTYHFCSESIASWHQFACYIINEANALAPTKISNVGSLKTANYPTPAKRPVYSVLDCSKINIDYGITQPDWKRAVRAVIPQLIKRNAL